MYIKEGHTMAKRMSTHNDLQNTTQLSLIGRQLCILYSYWTKLCFYEVCN